MNSVEMIRQELTERLSRRRGLYRSLCLRAGANQLNGGASVLLDVAEQLDYTKVLFDDLGVAVTHHTMATRLADGDKIAAECNATIDKQTKRLKRLDEDDKATADMPIAVAERERLRIRGEWQNARKMKAEAEGRLAQLSTWQQNFAALEMANPRLFSKE